MDKRRIVVISLTLLFFFLFFIGTTLFLKLKTKKSAPLYPKPSPTEIPWKTYVNQNYQYAISYPPDWQVEAWDIRQAANLTKIPNGAIWHQAKFKGEKGNFEILIWENQTKAPLQTWLTWFRHEDLDLKALPQKENFEVGGLPAILYSQKDSPRGKPLDHIFFKWEDKIYEFIEEKGTLDEAALPNYDKIISSLRFLEDGVRVKPEAKKLVGLAKEDLSKRLKVKKEEIRLLEVEEVDWPDTSLGCAQKGMFYAQVITPGYKITLEVEGKSYNYHSDYTRVILCQNSK